MIRNLIIIDFTIRAFESTTVFLFFNYQTTSIRVQIEDISWLEVLLDPRNVIRNVCVYSRIS